MSESTDENCCTCPEYARVVAERDEWKRRAEYAERELSEAFGLPSSIGPVEGEAKRLFNAAIAERDRLRAQVTDLLPEADVKQRFATRALRAEDRLDRLRRELESLRDEAHECARLPDDSLSAAVPPHAARIFAARLDAILRGG